MQKKLTWSKWLQESMWVMLAFTLLGMAFELHLIFFILGLLFLLLWQAYHLILLSSRFNLTEQKKDIPNGYGALGQLFEQLYFFKFSYKNKICKLKGELEQYQQGAQALPDALVVLDKESNIIWLNELAQQLLGLNWPADRAQFIGNLIRQPNFVDNLNNQQSIALEIDSPVNNTRRLEIRFSPYLELGRLMLVRDITHLKQLEGMRKNFLANVSHELRTPMTVLQGYVEILAAPEKIAKDRRSKTYKIMQEQLVRMNSLVEQLLTLSKIESAYKYTDLSTKIDVSKMLNIIVIEASAIAEQELIIKIDKDVVLYGNEQLLHSAMSNLIFNAIKHTAKNCEIKVSLHKVKSGVEFKVSDNGEGIAASHLSRLTERFYRVDKARSRKTGGSGLGLAIVKHALSHYNVQLQIISKLKVGSCFSFILPEKFIVIGNGDSIDR